VPLQQFGDCASLFFSVVGTGVSQKLFIASNYGRVRPGMSSLPRVFWRESRRASVFGGEFNAFSGLGGIGLPGFDMD